MITFDVKSLVKPSNELKHLKESKRLLSEQISKLKMEMTSKTNNRVAKYAESDDI